MIDSYKDKRFLVCQPIVGGINGSTMVALEICEYLHKKGANVSVFTYYAENPAKSLFERSNIGIIDFKENKRLCLSDYDYVWVHSQTMPLSFVDDLQDAKGHRPKFIFLHMSVADYIPDERPYIYELEQKLSSKTLFISEEVRDKNTPFFTEKMNYGFFRNLAPDQFVFDRKKTNSCKNILVVSNHPPRELFEAREIAAKKNIKITMLGEGQEKYDRFSPDILKRYDAIVTIGKTVQYCFMSGTPVYVYDFFGGPGWLNDKNFDKAKKQNFSGRGFSQKTAEQIVDEFINGYMDAQNYYFSNRQRLIDDFLIDKNFDNLLKGVEEKNVTPFSKEYALSVKEAIMLTSIRFNADREIRELKLEKTRQEQELNNLRNRVDSLEKDRELIMSSKSYRAISKISKIIRRK